MFQDSDYQGKENTPEKDGRRRRGRRGGGTEKEGGRRRRRRRKPDLSDEHVGTEGGVGYKCDYCDYVAGIYRYKILHEKKLHLDLDCKVCMKVTELQG